MSEEQIYKILMTLIIAIALMFGGLIVKTTVVELAKEFCKCSQQTTKELAVNE